MNWRDKRDRMQITFVSHGHWRVDIFSPYPRRVIKSCITTDSMSVDDYKAEEWEKDGRFNRRKSGTESLWNEVQYKHKRHDT